MGKKLVTIDTGDCGVPISVFGTLLARYTFDDGGKSYAAVNCFPSKEDMLAPIPPVMKMLELTADEQTFESVAANLVEDWTNVYTAE